MAMALEFYHQKFDFKAQKFLTVDICLVSDISYMNCSAVNNNTVTHTKYIHTFSRYVH